MTLNEKVNVWSNKKEHESPVALSFSYTPKRMGIGNRSPYELVDPNNAHMQLLIKELKMDIIPPDDVHLMPDLIK